MMRIRRVDQYRTRLIFEQAKKLWPKEIRIDDGKCNHFPSLSEAWDESERLAEELDEIDKLATWAMVCCLDELGRKRGSSACNEIFLSDVRLMRFDYQMRRNLVEPCWADEEILYNLANTQKRSYYFYKRDRKIFQSGFKPNYRKTVV